MIFSNRLAGPLCLFMSSLKFGLAVTSPGSSYSKEVKPGSAFQWVHGRLISFMIGVIGIPVGTRSDGVR